MYHPHGKTTSPPPFRHLKPSNTTLYVFMLIMRLIESADADSTKNSRPVRATPSPRRGAYHSSTASLDRERKGGATDFLCYILGDGALWCVKDWLLGDNTTIGANQPIDLSGNQGIVLVRVPCL